MKLPRTIPIKGELYRISKVNEPGKYCGDTSELDGYCDTENKVLYIKKTLKPEPLLKCLLHEANHGYIHECGIDQGLIHEVEEIIVESTANFYYQTMPIWAKLYRRLLYNKK